jgi:hypothetical protein
MSLPELDEFTRGYIECALWSSMDESTPSGGYPLDDNYDIDDIAPETLSAMIDDCREFQRDFAQTLATAYTMRGYTSGSAGHDFWLTRNRHGAGFWDRGLDRAGEMLSCFARQRGGIDLYVGDDKRVYA